MGRIKNEEEDGDKRDQLRLSLPPEISARVRTLMNKRYPTLPISQVVGILVTEGLQRAEEEEELVTIIRGISSRGYDVKSVLKRLDKSESGTSAEIDQVFDRLIRDQVPSREEKD